MRLKKVKIVLLLVIALLAVMAGNVFGIEWTIADGMGIKESAQGTASGVYCVQHGGSLTPSADYGTVEGKKIIYGGGNATEADIIVAYAMYLGISGNELQDIIWASGNNSGYKVALNNQRVREYRDIYKNIFSKGENILTGTDKSDNLKVLVDRVSGTYTVGPYKIDLGVGGVSNELKATLLKEIKTGKEGTNGAYAVFKGIEGINGDIVDLVYSDGSKIKSENGLSYGFPDFGKDFYIKFKPSNDGAIINTGNPLFKVKFLTNVTATVTRYEATNVEVEVKYNNSDFKAKAKFDSPSKTLKYNWDKDNPRTWRKEVNQTTTVKLTNNLKHNNGNVISKIEDIEVTLTRRLVYIKGQLTNIGAVNISGNLPKEITKTVAVSQKGYTQSIQTLAHVSGGEPHWTGEGEFKGGLGLPGTSINMQIGGTVWLETVEQKTGNYNGRYKATEKDNDTLFAGIQVDLYQADGTLVATTTTDKNGKYRFYGKVEEGKSLLNPLRQYYVVFEYDGQRYQATYYRNHISKPGGFSNAREVNRETYNAKFKEIYSDPENYEDNKRAYAIDHKIKKDDGTYATTGEKNEEGKEIALTYEDVYNKFLELATAGDAGEPKQGDNNKTWSNRSYTDIINDNNGLKKWLSDKGVNNEYESIKAFILDSLMKSSTQKDEKGETVLYPKYDKFVIKDLFDTNSTDYKRSTTTTLKLGDTYTYLYTVNYDMARYVDFGLCNRVKADIRLQKDVYKTTLIVNGKKEEYMYEQRDLSANSNNNNWDIRIRAADSLYNGTKAYDRDIRASEYLYDGSDAGTTDAKNLQAYVTYKIAFKNAGDVSVKVKEIVDYYDAEGYTYDGSNPNIADNTYIGDYEGKKLKDLTVSTTGLKNRTRSAQNKLQADGYKYEELYLTGMDDILTPGNVAWIYVTFKVNNDAKGKVQLDYTKDPYTTSAEEIKNAIGIGKQNIAEISAYETYYRGDGKNEKFVVPNYLNPVRDKDGKITDYELVNTDVSGKVAGLIDADSNPGSLSKLDLDANGNLKVEKTSKKIDGKAGIIASDRQEDDTSQAPNIRLIIDNDESDIRKISGYVFDDKRTENNDSTGNATIGNGKYDEGEDKVNGVTLQLVEIVPEIDEKGISTHEYKTEEHVWESFTYDPNTNKLEQTDSSRYSSGDGKTKIIVNGPKDTVFEVKDNEKLAYNDGYYTFKSLPAGDFYIRFTYGEHDDTVLTNVEDSDVNRLLSANGRNAKSYNGQDYKSTVYQKDVDQSNDYYNIKGYRDLNGQNYTLEDGRLNNGTDTKSMYYYDINSSNISKEISDAKDVWYYRTNSNNYSMGADGKTLLNKRAEVLASFEKLASFAPNAEAITENSYDYNDVGSKIYKYDGNQYCINKQREMVDALKANTYMVAQSGIINTEIEVARNSTQYDFDKKDTKTLNYTVDNVNFGLTERPEAQLKLNKEVSNYNLTLQDGQVLFDANKSVNNLSYSGHNQHSAEKENGLFKKDQPRVGRPGSGNSEIIQNYVDNEMLSNATVNVIYKLSVENVGEIDYKDPEFYYTGKESDKEKNISKTRAAKIVDYVGNSIKFDKATQQKEWAVSSADELIPSKDASNEDSNYVNRLFNPEISTYNTIITTEALGDELKPGDKREMTLALSSETAGNNGENNLVYNNMAEIIATSNDFGRRCVYSIPGNEEMADQNLGDNAASGTLSSAERIKVSEIDADSSQKIILMPPTGDEKDTTEYTVGLTLMLSITLAAVAGIKNLLIK